MFFGCSRADPGLAGAVVEAVVRDTLGQRDGRGLWVEVVIESDHRFTMTDNCVSAMDKVDVNGLPLSRWALGALLAVSARAAIEIRTVERQWLREFEEMTPVGAAREQRVFGSPGTRITCELDHGYFPATTVLPAGENLLIPWDDRVTVTDQR